MEPKRVLQVFASLDRGGAETMMMNVYRKIDRTKLQFDFVVNDRDVEYAYEPEIVQLGGRVFHIPRYTWINGLEYRKRWRALLENHTEWQVVHGHHTTPAFIYLTEARSLGLVTLAHSHTAGGEKTLKSYAKVVLRHKLGHIADDLFACSTRAAHWMFGKHGKRAYIVHNAVDTGVFTYNKCIRETKRKEMQIQNRLVIGHIGRFDHVKNHAFLLRILRAVHEEVEDAVLLLIGDGALRAHIEREVAAQGLADSVIFAGVRSDVPELLQAMDVFVFPSFFEGLPVTVIEAQAAGLPCVVSASVTPEVKVTDLVSFLPLSATPESWAKLVLVQVCGQDRRDMSSEMRAGGYDVIDSARWLQDFYIEAACNKGSLSGNNLA